VSGAVNRRQVLCGLALGIVGGGALAACAPTRVGGAGSAKPGAVLAKVGDVPVGGGLLADAGTNGLVLLTAPAAGVIHGFDPTCPHAGAKVRPPIGGVITCPAHGSQFDASTGALERGPAQRGLTPVPVVVKGANVVLA
jgi:nitrite reductase/ring-hydroxylating ferredoxin subunit